MYKILHGILPCGENLKRWRKKEHDQCDICDEKETIEHLIFLCPNVQNIWMGVNSAMKTTLTLDSVILGENSTNKLEFCISLIIYLIVKEWTNYSHNNGKRGPTPSKARYAKEIEYYKQICQHSKSLHSYINVVQMLLNSFCTVSWEC